VWQDYRNENYDIYGYNLLTGEEFQITMDLNDQLNPAIHGNTIVWADEGNGNIYGYDLSTNQEFQITTGTSWKEYPAIFGDIVVWQDYRDGNWNIYGKNIATALSLTIRVDKGCGGEYYVGDTLTVHWEASHSCEIMLWEKEPDGTKRKLTTQSITSEAGQYFREWTIEDYGYGKRAVYAEAVSKWGMDSAECEFHVLESDEDNDGVPDHQDDCDNPGCTIVDSDGCPKDSDGDGVNDCNDECPQEYGEKNNGCPSSVTFTTLLYMTLPVIAIIIVAVLVLKKKPERKKEEEEPHVLICPQCKNRIQEDWDTCPYCEFKLK